MSFICYRLTAYNGKVQIRMIIMVTTMIIMMMMIMMMMIMTMMMMARRIRLDLAGSGYY